MPCPSQSGRAACAQVVRQRPGFRGLQDHLWRRDAINRHHVVIDPKQEVSAGRLTINQAMTFYCGLLGIPLAFDDYPSVFRPARRFFLRVGIENVRVKRLQCLVRLKLVLDLTEELSGDRLIEAEDADSYLWVFQNLLNDPSEGDDRTFVMLATP